MKPATTPLHACVLAQKLRDMPCGERREHRKVHGNPVGRVIEHVAPALEVVQVRRSVCSICAVDSLQGDAAQ